MPALRNLGLSLPLPAGARVCGARVVFGGPWIPDKGAPGVSYYSLKRIKDDATVKRGRSLPLGRSACPGAAQGVAFGLALLIE